MLRSVRKRTAALFAGCLFAAQLVVVMFFAAPASADAYNCSTGYSSVGAYAYCYSGSSSHFVVKVVCQNRFTLASRVETGTRKPLDSQKPSVATCGWTERFYGQPWASGA